MGAEILTVGTELLLGQIVDTNASWIAQRLAEAGIDLFYKTTVGDNAARIEAAFRQGLSRADVIIATGGLGPTEVDLTRDVVAAVLPGAPAEMKPLLTEQVIPRIREAFGIGSRIVSRILKTCGISESKVDQAIGDYFREMRNPTIGVLAHAGEIHIRLTCKGDDPATINRLLDDLEGKIRPRLGPLIFGRDEETLEALV